MTKRDVLEYIINSMDAVRNRPDRDKFYPNFDAVYKLRQEKLRGMYGGNRKKVFD